MSEYSEEELVYVCMSCAHEDHPDKFGKECPRCGADLEQLEAEHAIAIGSQKGGGYEQ